MPENVQKTTFEAAEMILGLWNQQCTVSQQTITLKMAVQERSDFYVVFPTTLSGINFSTWCAMKSDVHRLAPDGFNKYPSLI